MRSVIFIPCPYVVVFPSNRNLPSNKKIFNDIGCLFFFPAERRNFNQIFEQFNNMVKRDLQLYSYFGSYLNITHT
jgi:hypothetical protein